MLISASRRTDIPAFYTPWLLNRLREGYCTVPNPFNARQVQRISLRPEEVEAIVFWTRHPRPLLTHLDELDARGYRYYFQYTLLDYPRLIDQNNPPFAAKVETFRELATALGPGGVIWRYDPIVLTEATPPAFHLETFGRIAETLQGYTHRAVISLLTPYAKIARRMQAVAQGGAPLLPTNGGSGPLFAAPWLADMLTQMAAIARDHGMVVVSCASELDMSAFGIRPGKCIDDELLRDLFGLEVSHTKDPGQRRTCGCVISKDIGVYDTCTFGCQYCYATSSFARAQSNHARHDPQFPSLL
jgi:hypothetical protein